MLNADRPFITVEEQRMSMFPVSRDIRQFFAGIQRMVKAGGPTKVALDPLSFRGQADRVGIQTWFKLRNRGKGVAFIDSLRLRMLLGNGLVTKRKLRTIGIVAAMPANDYILDPGVMAEYSLGGGEIALNTLIDMNSLNSSLVMVLLVRYRDIFRRSFIESFRFVYFPYVKRADGTTVQNPELRRAAPAKRSRYA